MQSFIQQILAENIQHIRQSASKSFMFIQQTFSERLVLVTGRQWRQERLSLLL